MTDKTKGNIKKGAIIFFTAYGIYKLFSEHVSITIESQRHKEEAEDKKCVNDEEQ